MKQIIVYSCLVSCVLFSGMLFEGCKEADTATDNKVRATTAYVFFGHRTFQEACRATGVCQVTGAAQNALENTTFQYVTCQRPDSTDSMTLSFYPNVLKAKQDSSHFRQDAQGKYNFGVAYVFDSVAENKTGIPKGTIIPEGGYVMSVTGSELQTQWTIIIPKVIRPLPQP